MFNKDSAIDATALILMIIGAINWGLVGLLGLDLVQLAFGWAAPIAFVVYLLIAISGLYVGYKAFLE